MSTTETITLPPQSVVNAKQSYHVQEPLELSAFPTSGEGSLSALDDVRDLPAPSTAVEALERWNYPRRNMYGIFGTYLSFLVLGLNDATAGALIPYLEEYYGLSYTVVSLLFLSPCLGYSLAAALNNSIHRRFGQRGIAFIAGMCHFVTYLTISMHPPWPVIVIFIIFTGFGNGLGDAGWCAWTGNMASANKVQGILQSFYSLGATISPLIATSLITKAKLPWYSWYYIMTGIAGLEWVLCTAAFWHKDGARYRADTKQEGGGSSTLTAIKHKVTLMCGAFFLIYVGAEVALGGWIVTFMLRVRHANPYASGISATGFWAGMTVGRTVLSFITERWGERLCVSIYLAIAIGLELIFWLVPQFVSNYSSKETLEDYMTNASSQVVSAVAVALLGFFFGPIFPGGIVVAAKLLPKHLHVSALGAATAIAGVGGAGIPFAVGAIAQQKGVWVLQPIILTLVVVLIALWLSLPRIKKRDV